MVVYNYKRKIMYYPKILDKKHYFFQMETEIQTD